MTIKRGKQPFTESCICGSIADACLKDLRINSAPNGFPRIEAARNPSDEKYTNKQIFGSRDTFKVTLSINKDVSSSISVNGYG